jgi:PAS domain S-box-containing protein
MLRIVAEKYPNMIRLVVTGYADIDVVMSAINHGGVFRYISKPWEKDDLQKAIDEALVTYRLREENEKLLHDVCESERKMGILLGNIPGMAYRSYAGDNWKTLFASNGCYDLFGYTSEEFTTGSIMYNELIESKFKNQLRQDVDNAISENRKFETQYIITTKNGVKKWVLERGQAIEKSKNGDTILEGFVTDITYRKNIELDLENALKRIEKLQIENTETEKQAKS